MKYAGSGSGLMADNEKTLSGIFGDRRKCSPIELPADKTIQSYSFWSKSASPSSFLYSSKFRAEILSSQLGVAK
jgi:hypothetical protein